MKPYSKEISASKAGNCIPKRLLQLKQSRLHVIHRSLRSQLTAILLSTGTWPAKCGSPRLLYIRPTGNMDTAQGLQTGAHASQISTASLLAFPLLRWVSEYLPKLVFRRRWGSKSRDMSYPTRAEIPLRVTKRSKQTSHLSNFGLVSDAHGDVGSYRGICCGVGTASRRRKRIYDCDTTYALKF